MNACRLFLLGLVPALAFPPAASALIVFDYAPATNERFLAGTFPSGPVSNGSFFLSSYNFSGVGWQTASTSFAVTLVSPINFLAARHAAPTVGAAVSFLGTDGTVRSYTVGSISTLDFSAGVASDLVVGTLTEAVSSQVTHYSSLYLGNDLGSYTGLNLAVYGSASGVGGRVGLNSITGFGTADFSPVDGIADNLFAVMTYNATTGGTLSAPAATQGQGGDSSSPSFVLVGGNLALLGVHSAINGTPPPEQTYDTFVPGYIAGIDSVLQLSGYSMGYYTAVPEPATVSLGLGLAACVFAVAKRRQLRR